MLDFGSQYSHLICRRIREFSVYAELVPYDISLEKLKELNPKGVIFSGGPSSVYNSDAPRPSSGIFQMKHIAKEQLELLHNIECPNMLFPYLREFISDLTVRAGFAPVILSPVNFAFLYQQKQQASANPINNSIN